MSTAVKAQGKAPNLRHPPASLGRALPAGDRQVEVCEYAHQVHLGLQAATAARARPERLAARADLDGHLLVSHRLYLPRLRLQDNLLRLRSTLAMRQEE